MNEMLTATAQEPNEQPVAAPAAASGGEQRLRAGAYGLLANLLRTPPESGLVAGLARHDVPEQRGEDAVATALRMLGLAARDADAAKLTSEFHQLFIGLGRGELVPYASWYLTGFLMERPLSVLRDDLVRLGFERQANVREPEDHVAALSEVMTLLIADGAPHEEQSAFFRQHLEPWVGAFYTDLEHAESACFYRAVGRFGKAFTDLEARYFSMRL